MSIVIDNFIVMFLYVHQCIYKNITKANKFVVKFLLDRLVTVWNIQMMHYQLDLSV